MTLSGVNCSATFFSASPKSPTIEQQMQPEFISDDLDSGFFQESAVDADLSEFVLDKHQLFAAVCFFNQFLYECGLSGSEKAGEYVNLDQLFIPPKRRLRLFNISLYHTLPTISSRQGKFFVTYCSTAAVLFFTLKSFDNRRTKCYNNISILSDNCGKA